jgi:hypothetical protein
LGGATATRSSLLTQQRSPISSTPPRNYFGAAANVGTETPYLLRDLTASSPSAKVLQEHAPGQSLPQGLAAGLSRLHLRGPMVGVNASRVVDEEHEQGQVPLPGHARKDGDDEEELFEMDG